MEFFTCANCARGLGAGQRDRSLPTLLPIGAGDSRVGLDATAGEYCGRHPIRVAIVRPSAQSLTDEISEVMLRAALTDSASAPRCSTSGHDRPTGLGSPRQARCEV